MLFWLGLLIVADAFLTGWLCGRNSGWCCIPDPNGYLANAYPATQFLLLFGWSICAWITLAVVYLT